MKSNAFLQLIEAIEREIQLVLQGFLAINKPRRRDQLGRVKEIKDLLGQFDEHVADRTEDVIKRASRAGEKKSLVEIPRILQLPSRDNFTQMQIGTVATLSENLEKSLGEASDTIGRRSADVLRKHGLRSATEHSLRNLPAGVQATVMQKRLEGEGLTAFVDKAGRRWKLSSYSKMAVRTTSAEAENTSVKNLLESRGLDLIRIDKHTHPSDVCTPFNDKTFSLTGKTPGYPIIEKLPPFHPQCECSALPAKEGLVALTGLAA